MLKFLKEKVLVKDDLPKLSDRKRAILYYAVDNYIKLASPITSLLVQKTTLHDLSTATIRNELNALEAMGFLKQLHTSSGRVPTTQAYRFFVNETLKDTKYSTKDLQDVRDKLFARTNNLSEIVESISKAISTKTNYPTVFMFDGFENLTVQSIKVIWLLNSQVLVLVETNAGAISNTIEANSSVTKQDCDNASSVFSAIFGGKNISYLTQNMDNFSFGVKESMRKYDEVFKLVLEVLSAYYNHTKSKVSNQGIIKLLESPDTSVESAKNILNVLDDSESLKNIMTTDDESVTVDFGEESDNMLTDCAVIKAPLVLDGKRIATFGIIGPERIDYANIAGVLKFVSDELKNKLTNGGKNDT